MGLKGNEGRRRSPEARKIRRKEGQTDQGKGGRKYRQREEAKAGSKEMGRWLRRE